MQSTSYEFTARGKRGIERPRLMSNWTLVGFAVVVLIPLVMIFPKQDLLRQAAQQRLGDALTVGYLTNLLKADPHNMELRILLAEHRIFLGETDGIPELIEPALKSDSSVWQTKGLLIEYKYLTRLYLQSADNSAQQANLGQRRTATFMKLLGRDWPVPTLVYLAGQADQLHESGIAAVLYRTLSDASATMPADWFAETAARVRGEGDYELAAHLYFIARHKETSLAKQRRFLMSGIRALMSGGFYSQAMKAIDQHLGNLEDDTETLYFLVQTARAANDQPRAVHYAKKLLHLSWLEPVLAWLQKIDLGLIGIANANADDSIQPQDGIDGIRPYNQRHYQLAFDVFVGNNNLAEAFRVAAAAVRQVPKDRVWHKRLAQVAEWTNKPDIALREWRWLLRNDDSKEALLAVLRLAPAQNDYDALLDAWKLMATRQKMNEVQLNNIADMFEQTGRQQEGITYFQTRYAADHLPLQLEIAARLAERSGDDELAGTLYSRLLKIQGPHPDWVIKVANLYLRKGEYQKAYDLLQKNRAVVDEKDSPFWKLLADLAWQLQQDSEAAKNYRLLASTGNLAREDISRLIYLLGDTRQEEQAALAELGYRRFGDRDMLLRALEIYAARNDLPAQKRLFAQVSADSKVNLSDNSHFYVLRAQFFRATGDYQAARSDFRHAAGIAPNDPNTTNAMLWFFIDSHDRQALREMVEKIEARGDHLNPAYWGALAAAYQVLDQPSRAVAYYGRQFRRGGQDFLWLVNFADALEQNRQAGMADRVRRQAWLQLRVALSAKPVKLPYSNDMLAAARLSMLNHPGDPDLALVRSVLRQDRLLDRDIVADLKANEMTLEWAATLNKHDAGADRTADELVLGWAISTEQSANAKAWLWKRYGQSLSRPLWADTAVAAAENDTGRLAGFLAQQPGGMPMLVRHDAAIATDQLGYAQSIVFRGLEDDPGNDEAYQRLSEDALATATFVDLELQANQFGGLHRYVQSSRVETTIAQGMRFAVEYQKTRETNDPESAMGNAPPNEKVTGIALSNHGSLGDTEIAVRRRNEYANVTESQVKHEMTVLPRLNLQVGLEVNAAADESNDLMVFGMRDQVSTGLLYDFSKRDYFNVEPGWARYYTQTGDFLGSGNHLSMELGHQIRTEYPNWKVRLIGIHTNFNTAANAVLPLPDNMNIYGVCFGTGELNRRVYTYAWRPYADGCATNNDLSGQGYNAMLGLAGSVAGRDQLSLTLSQVRGGANLLNGLIREFKLNYRYFID
ncbi:beta-barrel assembly-enhancing protease [mine drainage metagenome]|uniref:Beta-barrel assembly-enhancing protease n=1 Tax=mine drainage metagenome TaxID=410659 RepID=A0A1J5S5Q9_9ZZZZ